MKMRITPNLRLGWRLSPITPEMGRIRMYRSLKTLKYPRAKVVLKTGEVFLPRYDVNCSASVTPGPGVDRTNRVIVTAT